MSLASVNKENVATLANRQIENIWRARRERRASTIDWHVKRRVARSNTWWGRLLGLSSDRETVTLLLEQGRIGYPGRLDDADNHLHGLLLTCENIVVMCILASGDTVTLSHEDIRTITMPIS